MLKLLRNFWYDESGASTAEVVIVISVLVGIALLFRKTIWEWTNSMLNDLLPGSDNFNNTDNVIETSQ